MARGPFQGPVPQICGPNQAFDFLYSRYQAAVVAKGDTGGGANSGDKQFNFC